MLSKEKSKASARVEGHWRATRLEAPTKGSDNEEEGRDGAKGELRERAQQRPWGRV